MKKTFEKLRDLQEILLKEFEAESEIDDIPRELNELKKQYTKVERSIKEMEQSGENNQKKIKEVQKQKSELQLNKEKYEGQIPLIKTQKEYEALTSEIAQLDEKLQLIEEEELNADQEIESLNKSIEEMKDLHGTLKKEISEKQKEVNQALGKKQKELDKYLKEKEKISSGLDEEVIYKFEKIVRKKEGIGIVSIKNSICMGCNMILPPQFVNDVRREEEIIFCPNCSRILYYYDHEHVDGEVVV
ncbi:MAG: nucleic acid-binding protein [Spirochaetota bacterium]|nr:MAG: nucleic acid-binding protein [Spirochaetota bacterium]